MQGNSETVKAVKTVPPVLLPLFRVNAVKAQELTESTESFYLFI